MSRDLFPNPGDLPEEMRRMLRIMADPDQFSDEEVEAAARAARDLAFNQGMRMVEDELRDLLQNALKLGLHTNQYPNMMVAGALRPIDPTTGKPKTDVTEEDMKNMPSGLGCILVGNVSKEDARLFGEYIKGFVRDIKLPGSKIVIKEFTGDQPATEGGES